MPTRTDQLVSKGMEKAKAVKATATGISGVFKTLMKEHGEVSGLLSRAQKNAEKRADLWPQIRRELLSHERGELRVVYPVLREHEETREFADQHEADAAKLESQINKIDGAAIESTSWGEQFDRLVELVKEHVTDEESEFFPAAMDAIGDERANELDSQFLQVKKSILADIA
jgi:hemerythrin superfamily protein